MQPSERCYSQVLVAVADAVTLDHLIESDPAMVMLIGDLTYADDHLFNDTSIVDMLNWWTGACREMSLAAHCSLRAQGGLGLGGLRARLRTWGTSSLSPLSPSSSLSNT